MASQRWLAVTLSGILAACSGSDEDGACAPSSSVDDEEVVSTTQALSSSERQAVVRAIQALAGAPASEAASHVWSEAPGSPERALVRDLVETAWIDGDADLAARLVDDPSLLYPAQYSGQDLLTQGLSTQGLSTQGAPRNSAARSLDAFEGAPTEAAPRYTALRRVLAGGELVLAVSNGERAGAPYVLHDLLRVVDGRVVERYASAAIR